MPINNLLQKLGFSPNEIKVYLASLSTGLTSAQVIATKAGLKRTTTYSVLSYLVSRGVVGKTLVKGKTRFLAEPPQRLLSLISEIETGIKESLPELTALYNQPGAKPKITFYEGENAIHNVYEDTLKVKPAEILEWNTNAYFERFSRDYDYIGKRIKLGIHARRIAGEGSEWQTKHQARDEKELARTLIVPKDKFDPQIEVNIYGNKVAFMDYADNLSVIIESRPIADAMRQAYELSWQGAETESINKK